MPTGVRDNNWSSMKLDKDRLLFVMKRVMLFVLVRVLFCFLPKEISRNDETIVGTRWCEEPNETISFNN